MDTELTDSDPVQLGDWRVLSKLGEGGMGSVFLAERSGRHAAIKTLHPAIAKGADASERFQREHSAARRVRSPYVAEIIDADLSGARPFLAIEYVSGLTLEDYIAQNGPLSTDELSRFGHQLAVGIEAMHDVSVTHRDIKPSNVIMTRRGPVIIDFGIALLGESPQLTATNQIVGSPGWTSPEQLLGERVGTPADVFGWGAIMQYAATGRNPFGTGSPQAMMYRIAHGTPAEHSVPGELGRAISRSLDQAPANRPSVGELLAVTADGSTMTPRSTPGEGASTADANPGQVAGPLRVLTAAVALLTLAVLGLVAWLVFAGQDGTDGPAADQTEVAAPTAAPDPTVVVDAPAIASDADAQPDSTTDISADGEGSPASDADQEPSGAAALRESRTATAVPDLAAPDPADFDASALVGAAFAKPVRDGSVLTIGCPGGEPVSLGSSPQWDLSPGDTIELARGCTFVSPLAISTSGEPDNPITFRSAATPEDLPRAVITNDPDSNVGALIRLDASHVTISTIDLIARSASTSPVCAESPFGWVVGVGIGAGTVGNTVTSVTATGGYAGVHIAPDASDNTVSNSRFEANTMLNDNSGANGVEIFGNRNTVSDNIFVGNAACGEGAAVEVYGGSHNTIVRNRAVDNQSFVEVHGGDDVNPMGNTVRRNLVRSELGRATFVRVRAKNIDGAPNEISQNTAYLVGPDEPAGLRCEKPCSSDNTVYANNIVWASKATHGNGSYAGGSNVVWAKDGQVYHRLELLGGAPNITMEPQLDDPFAGSFVPTACSPAIDAASPELATVDAIDALSNPTPIGAGVDIGAVEAQVALPCAG